MRYAIRDMLKGTNPLFDDLVKTLENNKEFFPPEIPYPHFCILLSLIPEIYLESFSYLNVRFPQNFQRL